MAEFLLTFGIVCFVLAGLGLVATGILFFKLDIRTVIAELTGKTATEAIAKIRAESPMYQHRGRSLQNILDGSDTDGSLFSIDKLKIGSADAPLPAATKTAGTTRAYTDPSEQRTGLLTDRARKNLATSASAMASEQQTGLLADFAERQTELLSDSAEQQTELLENTTEQETSLLSDYAGSTDNEQ